MVEVWGQRVRQDTGATAPDATWGGWAACLDHHGAALVVQAFCRFQQTTAPCGEDMACWDLRQLLRLAGGELDG